MSELGLGGDEESLSMAYLKGKASLVGLYSGLYSRHHKKKFQQNVTKIINVLTPDTK